MKNLHTKKTSNESNFDWMILQMSINQKSGRQAFRRRFASGSLFVSPCPRKCYLQSETKIKPYLRLRYIRKVLCKSFIQWFWELHLCCYIVPSRLFWLAPVILLLLLKWKSRNITKHLMSDPDGNQLVLFSLESGKQN